MGCAVEREATLVTVGKVSLVGEDGTGMLGAGAAGKGSCQFDFKMNQERCRRGDEKGTGGCMLDCSTAEGEDQRVAGSQTDDGFMFAEAECRLPWRVKSSVMVTPASASITSSTSMNFQPRRAASSGPTVLLPEPMKPVRTMRRGGADVEWI